MAIEIAVVGTDKVSLINRIELCLCLRGTYSPSQKWSPIPAESMIDLVIS